MYDIVHVRKERWYIDGIMVSDVKREANEDRLRRRRERDRNRRVQPVCIALIKMNNGYI